MSTSITIKNSSHLFNKASQRFSVTSRQRASRRYASSSTNPHPEPSARSLPPRPPPPPPPRTTRRSIPLSLSLIVLPPVLYYLYQSTKQPQSLSPFEYSDHPLTSTRRLSPQHAEITVGLDDSSANLFAHPQIIAAGPSITTDASANDSGSVNGGTITVHHVMLKNPHLMIERPYTPVNDVSADGEARLVVKRVKGGEVGRMVHSLQPGQDVGLRGPLPTFTTDPSAYDRIVMISSGTGIAPFLQLLAKLPSSKGESSSRSPVSGPSSTSDPASSSSSPLPSQARHQPRLHLIHAASITPASTSTSSESPASEWVLDPTLLPRAIARHGDNLTVHRMSIDAGQIDEESITRAIRPGNEKVGTSFWSRSSSPTVQDERLMVLVCLPPVLMKQLCGTLTATLHQGELTGLLGELGLTKDQVWKLE